MSLTLRSTKGSPLTFSEMDGNLTYLQSLGFPFEGDALIDGTLNIDFTETLDFLNGEIDEPAGSIFPGNLQGKFIGFAYDDDAGTTGLSGWFDGIIDIPAFEVQLPAFGWVNQVITPEGFVADSLTQIDLDPIGAPFKTLTSSKTVGNGDDSAGVYATLSDQGDIEVEMLRESGAGIARIVTDMQLAGFDVRGEELNDPDMVIISFSDEDRNPLLWLTGKGLYADLPTSDPNEAGRLWNNAGTLSISAGI